MREHLRYKVCVIKSHMHCEYVGLCARVCARDGTPAKENACDVSDKSIRRWRDPRWLKGVRYGFLSLLINTAFSVTMYELRNSKKYIYSNPFNPHNHSHKIETIIIAIFQMRKLRLVTCPTLWRWHRAEPGLRTRQPGFTSTALTAMLPHFSTDAWWLHHLTKIYLNTFGFSVWSDTSVHEHTHTHSGTLDYVSWVSKLLESFPLEVHNLIASKTPYLTGWQALVDIWQETSEAPLAHVPEGWPLRL